MLPTTKEPSILFLSTKKAPPSCYFTIPTAPYRDSGNRDPHRTPCRVLFIYFSNCLGYHSVRIEATGVAACLKTIAAVASLSSSTKHNYTSNGFHLISGVMTAWPLGRSLTVAAYLESALLPHFYLNLAQLSTVVTLKLWLFFFVDCIFYYFNVLKNKEFGLRPNSFTVW